MNLRVHHRIVSLFLLATAAFASGQGMRAEAVFVDTPFRQGFLLSYPDSSRGRSVEALLNLGEADHVPVWRLCQWGTRHTLAQARCVRNSAGDLSYENAGKKVVVGGPDSANRDLILEIRGRAEYGDRARRSGEAWPHLLVEQDAPRLHPLDELEKVPFQITLRLLYSTGHLTEDDYDPGLHAAQFQMFFIIKNIHAPSGDHGDFFWFGVPFYDSRYDLPPAYMARDAGKDDATGKFIYTIDGKTVNQTPLKDGQWVTIRDDLLPHIGRGLCQAVERGYLEDPDPRHYAIANMNLGWEIPGTFDVAMQVRDFDVSAVVKTDAN